MLFDCRVVQKKTKLNRTVLKQLPLQYVLMHIYIKLTRVFKIHYMVKVSMGVLRRLPRDYFAVFWPLRVMLQLPAEQRYTNIYMYSVNGTNIAIFISTDAVPHHNVTTHKTLSSIFNHCTFKSWSSYVLLLYFKSGPF